MEELTNNLLQELHNLDKESQCIFKKFKNSFLKMKQNGKKNQAYYDCAECFAELTDLLSEFEYIHNTAVFLDIYTKEFNIIARKHRDRFEKASDIFEELKPINGTILINGDLA